MRTACTNNKVEMAVTLASPESTSHGERGRGRGVKAAKTTFELYFYWRARFLILYGSTRLMTPSTLA
eukprot:1183639-Prorocentrum_minimum.AAC.5